MDPTDPRELDPTYRLLALCAHAEGHPALYEQLTRQLENFTNWEQLPAQAEAYGMSPLLWHHIQQAGAPIPVETARILKGLYLRHRRHNQIHAQTLIEIVALFKTANIQPLALKGLGLAYGYYPDPALRPVSDLDFLLKQDDILPALDLLKTAGFSASPHPADLRLVSKELTADSPPRDGIRVHVELHYYNPLARTKKEHAPDDEFKGFNDPPQPLKMEQAVILVPSPMNCLDYLLRHFALHLLAAPYKPLQLKWSADILSIVERHAESMDWASIQRRRPALLRRLEVFYSFTPLPEQYENLIPIKRIPPPNGANQHPAGWPRQKFSQWKRVGFWKFLRHTFSPPTDWWLQLRYGIGHRSVFWYGQIVYRTQILGLVFWSCIRRIMKNKSIH